MEVQSFRGGKQHFGYFVQSSSSHSHFYLSIAASMFPGSRRKSTVVDAKYILHPVGQYPNIAVSPRWPYKGVFNRPFQCSVSPAASIRIYETRKVHRYNQSHSCISFAIMSTFWSERCCMEYQDWNQGVHGWCGQRRQIHIRNIQNCAPSLMGEVDVINLPPGG